VSKPARADQRVDVEVGRLYFAGEGFHGSVKGRKKNDKADEKGAPVI
jgi:hypothetical protein